MSCIYALSDARGFVGAFLELPDAADIINKYAPTPFIIQRFALAPGPTNTVWVVLYREIDAVAFVSNNIDVATRAQKSLLTIGATYDDSITYWEQSMNTIAESAAKHLDIISAAHAEFTSGECDTVARDATMAKVELLLAGQEHPAGRTDDEIITFMDCVRAVPIVGQKSAAATPTETKGDNQPSAVQDGGCVCGSGDCCCEIGVEKNIESYAP